jgi:tetratricopeptide (TPR) repeat protein
MAALILSSSVSTASSPSIEVKKAIKEAENLSVNQDRLLASSVLLRNLKKVTNKNDVQALREKLTSLTRVFYNDNGFEAYESGKEFFEKQKISDSVDKLLEADEIEKGNVDVLHLLTLSYLQLQKYALADNINKRALELCPFDLELKRDALAVLVAFEKWSLVQEAVAGLTKEFGDTSAQTLKEKGLAYLKLELKPEASKAFSAAILKDPNFPEPYFYLATLPEPSTEGIDPTAKKNFQRYVELCSSKTLARYDREINHCTNLKEAEKRVK